MGNRVYFIVSILAWITGAYAKSIDERLKRLPLDESEETERREICMQDLGCFRNTKPFDYPTWERLISVLPDTREEIGTEFRFFSLYFNPVVYINNFNFSSWDIRKSNFEFGAKTIFITHGFMGGNAQWALQMKDAILKKFRYNVFIVDWTNGHGPIYEQAVANIRVVGAELGHFILRLANATKMSTEGMYLIGHSLGAHASGYAGKWVRDRGFKVGRITGLDPAGPYFNNVFPVVRLDKEDASFVDVIHTNWADHRFSGYGLLEPIGHFDFYPNGGEDQPGCKTASDATLGLLGEVLPYASVLGAAIKLATGSTKEDVAKKANELSCSHGRAYELFIESINDEKCKFKAVECSTWEDYQKQKCSTCQGDKCVVMGYYADKYKAQISEKDSKKFFLTTTDKPPFCKD